MDFVARFLVRLILRVVRRFSDDTLRKGAELLFSRTRKQIEASTADVLGHQRRRLQHILLSHQGSAFGKEHDFSKIAGQGEVERAWQDSIPVQTWDDVKPYVKRMLDGEKRILVDEEVFFYATTSGTTGKQKYIPVTSAFVDECRQTTKILLRSTLTSFPGLVRGKRLQMRSPSTEELSPGVYAGSITVALTGAIPGTEGEGQGPFDALPRAAFEIGDFASRYFVCLRLAAVEHVTLAAAINPSTLLLFAQTLAHRAEDLATSLEKGDLGNTILPDSVAKELLQLAEAKGDERRLAAARIRLSVENNGHARMQDVFPDLVGLLCWKGGSAPWYLHQLEKSYGKVPVLDHGYAASEGIFGAPLSTEGAESLLTPHGHFFEFIPEEALPDPDDKDALRAAPKHLLHELQIGNRYYLIVTTGAGLYRYFMNDVVEVTAKTQQAPMVVFRQKGGAMSSLTGEKLGEAHVVQAMKVVQEFPASLDLNGFCVSPLLPESEDESPHYVLAVDVNGDVSEEECVALAKQFDEALGESNLEYVTKRNSLRLGHLEVVGIEKGAFAKLREARVDEGAPDAHIKIPHIDASGRLMKRLGVNDLHPEFSSRWLYAANEKDAS
ncbi:MAG: GH3 auxin-responsive promoter family protein [Deltaproteobacteria bacterium]|nr:GH3 auxin-responsive promoter family protein [Deltaproteobacteria bacterium]